MKRFPSEQKETKRTKNQDRKSLHRISDRCTSPRSIFLITFASVDRIRNGRVVFVVGLALWLLTTTGAVTLVTWGNPRQRAVLGMGWGLIIFWVLIGGLLMHRFRDSVRTVVLRIRLDWRIKFVIFCTALALLEEVITTTMTNLAPLFGVKVGEAYITASTNYFDVVALHSVVVFVPMWAVILWRYDFSSFKVFLLFGLTGTLAETNFGLKNPLEFRSLGFCLRLDGLSTQLLCPS